jgi:hypothetical protein
VPENASAWLPTHRYGSEPPNMLAYCCGDTKTLRGQISDLSVAVTPRLAEQGFAPFIGLLISQEDTAEPIILFTIWS